MKKIITICAIIFATALAFTSCAKECFECQYPGQDQDGDGYPDQGDGTNNETGFGYYYITEASSFQSIEVDISSDGYCDGWGTETWTIVTLYSDPVNNTGSYKFTVTHKVDKSNFNFSNGTFYSTDLGSLDVYYNCTWSGPFDPTDGELFGWWK